MNKMRLTTTLLFLFITAVAFAQKQKVISKELFTGKAGTQTITVYIETVQSFSAEFNDYITTAHKGWYKIANGPKIIIIDTWEGSGPMEFEESIKGKKVKTLELDDFTEKGKKKTLKGELKKNNKNEIVVVTLSKKV
jgi:hypothetical protein